MTNKRGHMLKIDHIKIRSAPQKRGILGQISLPDKRKLASRWLWDLYGETQDEENKTQIISKINSNGNYI